MHKNTFKALALVCVAAFSASSFATVSVVKKSNIKNNSVEAAKILYVGNVTEKSMTELIASIDEINATYPALKHLYLYINSGGGDMSSGYMAYEAVKSSPVPITTINLAFVASSATLFYCAGKERLTMPAASFILHPAAAFNIKQDYLKPNEIAQIKQYSDNYNALFRNVYKQCTSYNDEEINKMLFNEDGRQFINIDTALERKMSTGKADKMENVPVSYYILNEETNNG